MKEEDVPAAPRKSWLRRNIFPALIGLSLVVAIMLGIMAYLNYQQRIIEEQNEAIRQEILYRNLYYNYKPVSVPVER